MGVLVLICERPDNLPANPAGNGKAIEVMQVIAQAKASRGADVAELTEAEINRYLHQRAGPRGFLFGDWCRRSLHRGRVCPCSSSKAADQRPEKLVNGAINREFCRGRRPGRVFVPR
jgi:sarcosine oxidase delta subunit